MEKSNFWNKIKQPIFSLAPMEDVTDTVFREIVLSVSNPDFLQVLFTEFTSIDGMCHPVGKEKVSHRLKVNQSEIDLLQKMNVKLVAQIWGSDPEKFHRITKMLTEEWGFDGIDVNMGCPVKKIVKQATCSALIAFPDQAKEIVRATQEATHLPVSVKTRTGIKKHETETWIPHLLETKPDALILHGRSQKMQSDYPAEWDEIGKAVKLRNELSPETIIIGNGDLFSMADCRDKIEKYKVNGVMIGRGIFKDPRIFNQEKKEPSPEEKLQLLWKHTELFVKTWGRDMNFNIMKRFFKVYCNGFYGAAELRNKLMDTKCLDDVEKVLKIATNRIRNKIV
ncbi:MAG: tRNA-dihydrouridine synthase [Bacteroidota bacterium]|nr:tRNA-dihydrouridine synthase [Bacteroidota bacterium]